MKLLHLLLLATVSRVALSSDLCAGMAGSFKTKATAKCTDLECKWHSWPDDFGTDTGPGHCCEVDTTYKQPCHDSSQFSDSGLGACDGADTDTANYEVTASLTAKCAAAACTSAEFAADGVCCVAENEPCADTSLTCGEGAEKVGASCAGAKCADSDFPAAGAGQCCHGKQLCSAKTDGFFSCDTGTAVDDDDDTTLCAGATCDATTDKPACCKALPSCASALWDEYENGATINIGQQCDEYGHRVKASGQCSNHGCGYNGDWHLDFNPDHFNPGMPHCCEADSTYKEFCLDASYDDGTGYDDCTGSTDTAHYEPVFAEKYYQMEAEGITDYSALEALEASITAKCAGAECAAADFVGGTGACCVKKNQFCRDSSESCSGTDVEVEPNKRCAAAVCTADEFGDATKSCCREEKALCSSAAFTCDAGMALPTALSGVFTMSSIGGLPTGVFKRCTGATCTEADDKALCCMALPTCASFNSIYVAAIEQRGPEAGQEAAGHALQASALLLAALVAAAIALS